MARCNFNVFYERATPEELQARIEKVRLSNVKWWADADPEVRAARIAIMLQGRKEKGYRSNRDSFCSDEYCQKVAAAVRTIDSAKSPKLTDEQVLVAREKLAEGWTTGRIGRLLGVSAGVIYHIQKGKTYRWVKEPTSM